MLPVGRTARTSLRAKGAVIADYALVSTEYISLTLARINMIKSCKLGSESSSWVVCVEIVYP